MRMPRQLLFGIAQRRKTTCIRGHEGARQGRPLPRLLFAAASDLVPRRLARHFPRARSRAWAGDLAVVLFDGAAHLAALLAFFDDFALARGLRFNASKTAPAPFGHGSDEAVRSAVSTGAPGRGGVFVASSAKYSGLCAGPGRGQLSWRARLEKYMARAQLRGASGLARWRLCAPTGFTSRPWANQRNCPARLARARKRFAVCFTVALGPGRHRLASKSSRIWDSRAS